MLRRHNLEAPKSNRTSISAIVAVILTVVTLPGVFCCAGFGTGFVAVVLGIIAIVQFNNGEANKTSAIMGAASILGSVAAMIGYLAIFGATMAMSADDVTSLGSETAKVETAEGETHEVPTLELRDLKFKIDSSNPYIHKVNYSFHVVNNSKIDETASFDVKFLDADELPVERDFVLSKTIGAGGATVTESTTVSPQNSSRIESMLVERR